MLIRAGVNKVSKGIAHADMDSGHPLYLTFWDGLLPLFQVSRDGLSWGADRQDYQSDWQCKQSQLRDCPGIVLTCRQGLYLTFCCYCSKSAERDCADCADRQDYQSPCCSLLQIVPHFQSVSNCPTFSIWAIMQNMIFDSVLKLTPFLENKSDFFIVADSILNKRIWNNQIEQWRRNAVGCRRHPNASISAFWKC